MIKNIECLGHSTIKLLENCIIYIDPFNIKTEPHDADFIFVTHNHYDHFSKEDIKKCMNDNTKIIITEDLFNETLKLNCKEENIISVIPNRYYEIGKISFTTIPAYNTNKNFHPQKNNWVGYIIKSNDISYYIAGDTDITEEAKKVKCDIAFLPVGGTYTMDYKEAAYLANIIQPKIVIPIHYGSIVGTIEDAVNFKESLNSKIKCEICFY